MNRGRGDLTMGGELNDLTMDGERDDLAMNGERGDLTMDMELPVPARTVGGRMLWALRDGWTITRRVFGHLRREPGQLVAAVVFPAVMVLLFGYVFGSAIKVPGGGNYREYLLPGLFAMTAIAGVMASALLTSKDVAEGVMDRFRSMPMARSAVPFGRTAADLLANVIGLVIMAAIGLVVGWRAHNGVASTLAAFGLILLLRYAVSWVGVWVGLSVTPQTADSLVPLVFPVTMISNSFVPTAGMPPWLRLLADWNPISALVAACRSLFGNPTVVALHASFPLRHPVVTTVAWSLLLLLIFVPLSARRYQSASL
jgi:ABC-2 type transport system permease protein